MKTRVYRYGLLPPSEGAERAEEQLRLAHRYRNQLVEIERDRRAAVREVLGSHADTEGLTARVAELVAGRDAARAAIKEKRRASRSRSETAADRERVHELGAELKAARAELRAAKTAIREDPEIQAGIAQANERATRRIKDARAASGCYWGTYLLIEEDMKRARGGRMDPKFRRWTGEGRLGVQIQGGIEPRALWGSDSRIQIDPIPPEAWKDPTGRRKGRRRPLQRTRVRLRVGSNGRAPIWAEWPAVIHRPIPDEGRIKWAYISRTRRDCRRWRWQLHIVVALPDEWRAEPAGEGGAVAVDLGWRQLDGGIRAGYGIGDDGAEQDIRVPARVTAQLAKSSELRALRDSLLNYMQPALLFWLAGADLPEWLAEAAKNAHKWRSAMRFHRLAHTWRTSRFEGDEEGYRILEEWRYRDEHLERWQSGAQARALAARKEHYRLLGAELARRYGTLILESFDLRRLARRPQAEEDRTPWSSTAAARHMAAPSELRGALVNAFDRRGGRVLYVDPAGTTRDCHRCGTEQDFDQAEHLFHTCTSCGELWDQDANAARNLLIRQPQPDALRVGA